MAKLVDAPSSGGGVRKDVLVRIQSRAQDPRFSGVLILDFTLEFAPVIRFVEVDGLRIPPPVNGNDMPAREVVAISFLPHRNFVSSSSLLVKPDFAQANSLFL